MHSNDPPGKETRKEHEQIDSKILTDTSDRFGRLFHLIGDAVVEIELSEDIPVVRNVNPAFEEIFGYDKDTILGESVNEYIIPDGYDAEATTFDRRTARGKPNHAIVRRQTTTGIREFLYRGVPYIGPDGRQFAFAIYSDITEKQTYERHIQVIHRILRHNLRNDLSVILGAASEIRQETDSSRVEDLAEMILASAESLDGIGEETRVLQRILTEAKTPKPIDIAHFCRETTESVSRCNPEASLLIDVPDTLYVRGIPELRTAIEGLIQNAVLHNTDVPHVTITGTKRENQVVLEIKDDGPGIPKHELTPLLSDTEITQLQHGSGLGLWLTRYAVETCDGQIEYERTDDGWTVLRLRFRPPQRPCD
jgi:PAS domain S-box-containing protein